MLPPSGNPFKCHEEILLLQPMIPPKHFDMFPPDWEMDAQKVKARSDFSLKTRTNLVGLRKENNDSM